MAKKTIKTDNGSKDFDSLVRQIQTTSDILQQDARLVINRNVTTRAWLTGFYIVEYEQHGSDRAKYGENLLLNLSKRLDGKSFGLSSLKNYRQFYLYYPELVTPIVAYLQLLMQKSQSLFGFLQSTENQWFTKGQTPFGFFPASDESSEEKSQALSDLFGNTRQIAFISKDGFALQTTDGEVMAVPQMAFNRIPFSHFTLLIHIEDPLKRAFYAIETMRGP